MLPFALEDILVSTVLDEIHFGYLFLECQLIHVFYLTYCRVRQELTKSVNII